MYYKLPSVRIARCYFLSGILYMPGDIFHLHPNSNCINIKTNPNPNPKPNPNNTNTNTSPNNPNHNHTPRMENSLEQMQSSVPGDGKCHLRCASANAKLFAGWRAEIPIGSLDGRSATVVQLSWRKSHNWRTISDAFETFPVCNGHPRSTVELETRSCNELTSGLYMAPFSVLSSSVGKQNDRTPFSIRSLVHSSKAFPRFKLFTLVKTTTLNCTHKRRKDRKLRHI